MLLSEAFFGEVHVSVLEDLFGGMADSQECSFSGDLRVNVTLCSARPASLNSVGEQRPTAYQSMRWSDQVLHRLLEFTRSAARHKSKRKISEKKKYNL